MMPVLRSFVLVIAVSLSGVLYGQGLRIDHSARPSRVSAGLAEEIQRVGGNQGCRGGSTKERGALPFFHEAATRLQLRGGEGNSHQVKARNTKKGFPEKQATPSTTAMSVLFYLFTSLSLTLMNKGLFEHFQYPLLVTEFQLIVAMCLLCFFGQLGSSYSAFAFAPQVAFDARTAGAVAPLTALFVTMLALTNYCLRHVDVSFYQVLRSLVIPFNIAIGFAVFGHLPSANASLCCLVVMVGFLLGSVSELNFSQEGFIFGVLSSVTVALYSVSVKKVLPVVAGDTWRLMHYTTMLGLLMLAPAIFFTGEWSGAVASGKLSSPWFWLAMSMTAVVGFLINIAYFALIKFGSPLSTHVTGCTKSALQTVLSILIFGNRVSFMNCVGIGLTLVGSALFSLERYLERQRAERAVAHSNGNGPR